MVANKLVFHRERLLNLTLIRLLFESTKKWSLSALTMSQVKSWIASVNGVLTYLLIYLFITY
jgi:hypothetical protein